VVDGQSDELCGCSSESVIFFVLKKKKETKVFLLPIGYPRQASRQAGSIKSSGRGKKERVATGEIEEKGKITSRRGGGGKKNKK
jgi:hypothetical protein